MSEKTSMDAISFLDSMPREDLWMETLRISASHLWDLSLT